MQCPSTYNEKISGAVVASVQMSAAFQRLGTCYTNAWPMSYTSSSLGHSGHQCDPEVSLLCRAVGGLSSFGRKKAEQWSKMTSPGVEA